MPQVFKIGSYWVYFWANENDPLEPIHVHVSQGAPSSNATKDLDHAGRKMLSVPQQFQHSAPCSAKHHGHHRSTKR